jgi:multidrug efflux pump subunit AcrA (membrane-fusion protein)
VSRNKRRNRPASSADIVIPHETTQASQHSRWDRLCSALSGRIPRLRLSAARAELLRRARAHPRSLLAVAVGLTIGGVLAVFLKANHAKDMVDPIRARQQGRPIPVRTAQVVEGDVEQVIGATGVTMPSLLAPVRIGPSRGLNASAPESDIVLRRVLVHDGEHVNAGQVLFELEDDIFQQVQQQREAAVARARAELERAQDAVALNDKTRSLAVNSGENGVRYRTEDLHTRRSEFEALDRLHRVKAVSDFVYFEGRSAYHKARFELSVAEQNLQLARNQRRIGALMDRRDLAKATNDLEMARIDLAVARHDLDRCQIRSPIDGFVGKVDMVAGTVVAVAQPLTQVLQLDPMFVRMDFPQERLDEVAIGQQADIVLDSFPKETFTGKVIRILPQVKADLRVMAVIIELSNSGDRIKPGISGFVRLRVNRRARTVPALAVVERGGKAIAFRIEDGRAHIREVTTGPLIETGVVEVRSGLEPGDEVVVFHSNFYRHGGSLVSRNGYLLDNDLVDVDWRKWARRE